MGEPIITIYCRAQHKYIGCHASLLGYEGSALLSQLEECPIREQRRIYRPRLSESIANSKLYRFNKLSKKILLSIHFFRGEICKLCGKWPRATDSHRECFSFIGFFEGRIVRRMTKIEQKI